MRVLITSGGTKIPIDSVRHIGNMSSGTFGSKIAYEALKAGQDVTFLYAKDSKTPLGLRFDGTEPTSVMLKMVAKSVGDRIRYQQHLRLVSYSDFTSYENNLYDLVNFGKRFDAIVLAAAVSDYGVINPVNGKIRTKGDMIIELTPLPKLISRFSFTGYNENGPIDRSLLPPKVLVGFKLLVGSTSEELVSAARKSVVENKCDFVVANDLADIKRSDHCLTIVSSDKPPYTISTNKADPNYLAREVVRLYSDCYLRKL